MRSALTAAALLLSLVPKVVAQAPSRVTVEAGFGVAIRGQTPLIAGETEGLDAEVGIAVPASPALRLVGELSFTRFTDEQYFTPGLCAVGQLCSRQQNSLPGLGVAGFAIGVQPRFGSGPLQLLMTATGGGFWLYHRNPALPAVALGLRGSVGLGFQVDPRVMVLMQGGGLFLLHSRAHEANTRHFGLGIVLN